MLVEGMKLKALCARDFGALERAFGEHMRAEEMQGRRFVAAQAVVVPEATAHGDMLVFLFVFTVADR